MKKRVLAVFIMICTLLCACGSTEQVDSGSDVPEGSTPVLEEQWTLKETVLPDGKGALGELVLELYPDDEEDKEVIVYGSTVGDEKRSSIVNGYTSEIFVSLREDIVYRYLEISDGTYVKHYCIQTLEPPYTEWKNQVESVPENSYLWRTSGGKKICLLPDGELNTLFVSDNGVDRQRILLDGTYEAEHITLENAEELADKVEKWCIHKDMDYVYTPEGLVSFQEDFAVSENIGYQKAMFIWQMAETPSGEGLYLYGVPEDGMGMAIWSAEESEPVIREDIGCLITRSKLIFTTETEGYLCDINGVWQFSVSEGTIEGLEEFQDYGIHGLKEICALSFREDGTLFILALTEDGYSLIERSQRSVADKKRLELAVTTEADQYLKEAVVLFNNSNEEYEIELREMGDEYYEEYHMRIRTEISSGGGPDLIDAGIINLEECASRGFLLDLTDAFAEEREAMVVKAMECGMVKGRQYAIPYLFQVSTLLAGENIVGDRTDWTLKEAMELTRESDVDAMLLYTDSAALFRCLGFWNENNPQLIDWDTGESRLNGSDAMELLRFAEIYGEDRTFTEDDQAAVEEGNMFFNSFLRVVNGEVLATVHTIGDISELAYLENLFRIHNNGLVFVGFPVEEGKSGYTISGRGIAVNQACEYPEGAIAFLHFLQSEERQQTLVEHKSEIVPGFPVRQNGLEQIFERAKQGKYGSDKIWIGGEGVDAEPMSQEVIDRLWHMIEIAEPISERMDKVLIMMDEETVPYFKGDRTAQEALDILQNRVQLYMDEIQ